MLPLILGSSSVNRRELLSRLRLPFSVCSPDVDETPVVGESPVRTAKRLAHLKAQAVCQRVLHDAAFSAERQHEALIIIASDQVAFRQQVGKPQTQFDKPLTRARAIEQLLEMQGGRIAFMTALEVLKLNPASGAIEQSLAGGVMTYAMFRPLTEAQIDYYVDVDQPLQCAGAAKCESLGIALLSQVTSTDPTALIGLPLVLLTDFLETLGLPVLAKH